MGLGPEDLPRPAACAPAEDEPWLAPLVALGGAFAPRTLEAYVRSFRFFQAWCVAAGRNPLPADAATVAAFLDAYARLYAPRTMINHLLAVRRVHLVLGFASPTGEEPVRIARRRHMRTAGPRPRRFEITAEVRERLLTACPPGLIGLRDRAMISLGFDTLCRRRELTAFRIEDLKPLADGTAELRIRGRSPGKGGDGAPAFLSARGLKAVAAWLDAAGLTAGPILRGVRNGRAGAGALAARTVNVRLREIAARAGFADEIVRRMNSHSLRIGAAQALGASGRTLIQIMRAGRWRSPDVPAGYLRQASANVWVGSDGDIYPVSQGVQRWRAGPPRK